jgi:hypothetical protein
MVCPGIPVVATANDVNRVLAWVFFAAYHCARLSERRGGIDG